jgi:iron complex outermembrane recepter protein
MHHHILIRSTALGLIALAGWPTMVSAQDSAAVKLDEIVVTAERREERLQDVPLAVTAFGGETLQNRQVNNMVDIMTTIPNLHASNNIGQGSATTVFLRGVGETESIITIDTPVGFYLDDVFIARQGVNNMALFDVERIEVLRGPQGTLYGRNTSAGAIKVVTKQPEFDGVSGMVEGSYGRFDAWSAKGSINLPMSDTAAVRATAIVSGGGGDTLNRVGNTRVNETDMVGFRLAGRVAASDTVDIVIAGDYSRANQNGRYGIDVAGILRPPSGSLFVATSGTDSRNVGKAYGVNGTVTWDAAEAMTVKSITAYRETTQNYNLDLTDQNPSTYTLYTDNKSKQFSQEFQASGSFGERLDYVAGLYYFDESSDALIGDYLNVGPPAFNYIYLRKNLAVSSKSYAAFAQFNFDVTDQFGLIIGGRYTHDKKSIDIAQIGDFTGTDQRFNDFAGVPMFNNSVVCNRVIAARPGRPVDCDLTFNRFTPKFGLEFKPTEDVLLYATYTKGYKSGGWSARVTDPNEFFDFDPESINSYELGLKSTVLNGRGTVNITGFYYDYKNLFNTGTTSAGSFGIATSNAEIYGIEAETNWQLTDGVRAFANLAWQDNKRKSVTASTLVLGDRLQRTPKWQAAIGVNVDREISDTMDIIANADYSYMSKHFVSPQNFPVTETGPVNLVNASLGVRLNKRYDLLAGCKNCFGDIYFNQALPFAAFGFVTIYPAPRATWSLTARARF